MCTNEELQQQITSVDNKLDMSIKDRKAGMSALVIKVDSLNTVLCGVKDDIAEVKRVLDKKVLTALTDHKEMVLKNNEELSKLKILVDLAPSIQDLVDDKKTMQKMSKWSMAILGFVALVIGIIFTLVRLITGKG